MASRSAKLTLALGASLVAAFLVAGCSDDHGSNTTPADPDAGTEAGTDDLCPDPDDPRVHYRSENPNDCIGITVECTADQNGFRNACGCGCIDKGDPLCPPVTDPSVEWVSMDPSECAPEPPECELGQFGFSNECGCGCMTPGG